MIELIVYIPNLTQYEKRIAKSVDLYGDEPINLELSFAEIQDISTKTGSFTKSFTIPGSKNNNNIFNNFYNPASLKVNFDSRAVFDATIKYNGYDLVEGYLRLESATSTRTGVEYSINFAGNIGRLVSKISDKTLNQLDTSDLDHLYNWQNICGSWNIDETNGFPGLKDGAILYPLLDRGGLYREEEDGSETRILPPDWTLSGNARQTARYTTTQSSEDGDILFDYFPPAIQLKALFEKIVENAGFKVESEYFEELWFRRIYLPLTTTKDRVGLLQNDPHTFQVKQDSGVVVSSGQTITLDNITILEDNTGQFQVGVPNVPDGFLNDRRGFYEFEVAFDYINNTNTDTDIIVKLEQYTTPPPYITFDSLIVECDGPSGNTGQGKVKLFSGLEINQLYCFSFALPSGGGNVSISNVNIKVNQYPNAIYNQIVNISQNFPEDYKQIDIISGVLKQFNLVMVPKPGEDRILQVEPMLKWIGRGELVDWTDKLDRSKPITVTDTTKFINGTLQINNKKSDDTLNKTFKEDNDIGFQDRKQPLLTEYRDEVLKIESEFAIPLSERIQPTYNYTLPAFYKQETSGSGSDVISIRKPISLFPHLIWYTGRRNINNDILVYMNYQMNESGWSSDIRLENQSWWPQSHHLTYFPVVTATQNRSIGFNKDQQQGDYQQIEVHDDSYTLYYENMINEYLDEESRFMVGTFYLTPEEVKSIDFRERILVDNTQYRINKISDYNLVQGGLCKVELLKLTKDYSIFDDDGVTDQVELEACGVGVSSIYTTLALSPTIYQYTDLIVKVQGVCYIVRPPEVFDDTKFHYPIQLDTGGDGQVLTFNECIDCGESGGICEDIIDIEPLYGGNDAVDIIGIFEIFDESFPPECTTITYRWQCGQLFTEEEDVGQTSQCGQGWEYLPPGPPITIPAPILREGYLLEECCFDVSTGFYYDHYVEIDTIDDGRYGTMIMHKLCCDTPPGNQFYRIRSCYNPQEEHILYHSEFDVLELGKVYDFRLFLNDYCSGALITFNCYEVVELLNSGPASKCLYQIVDEYDTCEECTGEQPPTYYYYELSKCGEQTSILATIQTTQLTIGDVYDLEFSNSVLDGCYEVLATVAATDSDLITNVLNNGNPYVDCDTCQGITTTTTSGTTTTTTTISPTVNYLVRDCQGFKTRVVSSQTPLNPSDVVYISGSANVGVCWEVLTTSGSAPEAIVTSIYDGCNECLLVNGGGGGSSST